MKNSRVLYLFVIMFLFGSVSLIAGAQTTTRSTYKSERFGISFDYDASFKLVDNSADDRFKVVLEKETFFIYITLLKQGKTSTPFGDFVAGFRSFTNQDTAGKNNYKMGDLAALKKDIAGNKAYTFSEFYSFDNGPMTNHYIFMEFPFRDKTGIAIRARTFNSGSDFYLANDEMMAILGSFKKI